MQAQSLLFGLTTSVLLGATSPAHADAISAGNAAYAKGDIGKAVKKWQKSPKAEAIFRIAELAEAGKLQHCDVVYCAVSLYRKAALAGHIPSVTHVAILNFNNGFEEEGLNQFRLAARLNDPLARNLLAQMKQVVPEPDLYNQLVEDERQRQLAAQAAKEQRALARQQAQQEIMGMLALGVALYAAKGAAQAQAARPATYDPEAIRTYSLTQEWFATTTDKMCRYENNTVLNVGSRSCPPSVRGR